MSSAHETPGSALGFVRLRLGPGYPASRHPGGGTNRARLLIPGPDLKGGELRRCALHITDGIGESKDGESVYEVRFL